MLPYPTDRRRLLMMVRVFLQEFSDLARASADGWTFPSKPGDVTADHQLEAFLERLAFDAGLGDDAAGRTETEADVQSDIEERLRDLLQHAAWNRNRISLN